VEVLGDQPPHSRIIYAICSTLCRSVGRIAVNTSVCSKLQIKL